LSYHLILQFFKLISLWCSSCLNCILLFSTHTLSNDISLYNIWLIHNLWFLWFNIFIDSLINRTILVFLHGIHLHLVSSKLRLVILLVLLLLVVLFLIYLIRCSRLITIHGCLLILEISNKGIHFVPCVLVDIQTLDGLSFIEENCEIVLIITLVQDLILKVLLLLSLLISSNLLFVAVVTVLIIVHFKLKIIKIFLSKTISNYFKVDFKLESFLFLIHF